MGLMEYLSPKKKTVMNLKISNRNEQTKTTGKTINEK